MKKEHKITVIEPVGKWSLPSVKELIQFKDLLWVLLRRDIVSVYKQTLLGPLWFFLQPILTSTAFTIIFSNIAGLSTDGVPAFLFYLCGTTFWGFFSSSVQHTSNIFGANQHLFGKVYFPRLLVPISTILSNFIKLFLQMALLLAVWLFYYFKGAVIFQSGVFLLPLVFLQLGLLGLGFGLILSSASVRFRDLTFITGFILQLAMYLSPVIYPIQQAGKYLDLMLLNPVAPMLELARFGLVGKGYFTTGNILYSILFSLVTLILGMVIFQRTEKTFIDRI